MAMRATITSAVAIAIVFVILEQTARIFLFGTAGLDPRKIQSLCDFRATEFVRPSKARSIGFEHVPNRDGFFKLVPYHTNSEGLRDRDYTLEKSTNTFRVAVLGSSFTVPAGVRIEEAFHTLMEEQLNEASDSLAYEFINFAIGAAHPRQVLSILQLRALAWEPDLILFGVTSMSMPFLVQARGQLLAESGSWPLPPTNPFFESYLLKLVRQRLQLDDLEIPVFSPKPARGEPSILQALGSVSRRRGIPIAIVRLEFDADRDPGSEPLVIEAARREGLYFYDTRDRFEGVHAPSLWIHPLDPHPNARAHATFADAVTDFLHQNSLLPRRVR
jgi:hypothetical protein